MEINISFRYDNGTHHEIIEKAKKQIGNHLDNFICQKHDKPPSLIIVNVKPHSPNKDIIEFKPNCCCEEFNKIITKKLEAITNSLIFRLFT